jgi:exodeoxyribonuclease-1
MQPTIHFYDAQYIGTPALGQLVAFDSLVCTQSDTRRYSTRIRLRQDASFSPQAVEQLGCYDQDLGAGETEYEWSRKAQSLFESPATLHVGLGNTSSLDNYIRFALYRCLSTLPNTELPSGAYYLDLLTVSRALSLLRPESDPHKLPAKWNDHHRRNYVLCTYAGLSGAECVKEFACSIAGSNPGMFAHAIAHSSPSQIASLCGLIDGQVESLSLLKPVFLCHEQLMAPNQFGVFLALGTDPQYRNIVYMVDLQCDLTELIEDAGESVAKFIRSEAGESDKPVVRVNLNRIPFASPLGVVDRSTAARLGIDPSLIKSRVAQLHNQPELCLALLEVSGASGASLVADPDFQLYGAEYLEPDKALLSRLHQAPPEEWGKMLTNAHDARITALGERLIRRCKPALLSKSEMQAWVAHCASRLVGKGEPSRIQATKDYCSNVAGSPSNPLGMRTAAQHWLHTTGLE